MWTQFGRTHTRKQGSKHAGTHAHTRTPLPQHTNASGMANAHISQLRNPGLNSQVEWRHTGCTPLLLMGTRYYSEDGYVPPIG